MLYKLLKIPATLAFYLYCRSIHINNKAVLSQKGPLLIAANHPDSFLDAIVFATLFKAPVFSLTRGDVYTNDLTSKLLTAMHMLPIFRISEGAENLDQNYQTFSKCREIFKQNGIVLIFSEGACVNEWNLRPLKKGTARLVLSSWEDGIDLRILPAGINYQSFTVFGKNIEINFGEMISKKDIDLANGYGKTINNFNNVLKERLKPLVVEIPSENKPAIRSHFKHKQNLFKKILLIAPAIIGWVFHAPLYSVVQQIVWKKAGHTGHYDSIIVAALFAAYPFYLALLCLLTYVWFPGYYWVFLLLLPFCAWSYVQIKRQFDH